MMKNSLIKFITSLLLFFGMLLYYFNPFLRFVAVVVIALCVVKFFVVMILEPDSIWEIIKKFFYIIIGVLFVFGLVYDNVYCERIAEVWIAIDTVIEVHRFKKNVR